MPCYFQILNKFTLTSEIIEYKTDFCNVHLFLEVLFAQNIKATSHSIIFTVYLIIKIVLDHELHSTET